jgi:PAS domain S-box-containing protein
MLLSDPIHGANFQDDCSGEFWPGDYVSLLKEIIRSSDDAIITKSLQGIITSWNPAAVRLFGYPPDEMVGKSILQLIPVSLQTEESEILNRLIAGERIEHYRTVRLKKNGEEVYVSLTISPLKNGKGDIVGASKVIRDITHQREWDEACFRLAAIVESSDDAILSKNLDGCITSWNAAATRMFGYSESEMVGSSVLRLIPDELHSEESAFMAKIRAGQKINHYQTIRLKNGNIPVEVSLTISPIRDASGKIIGASKVLRDISAQKLMELSLTRAEKLAATGRMAATLAHEINNPLEAVLNLIYLARISAADARQVTEFLCTAESELVRVSHIARSALGYYREHAAAIMLSMASLVEDGIRVYEPRIKNAGIEIKTQFSSVQPIMLKRGEIMQVISNLIVNAIHAMQGGGTLALIVEDALLSGERGVRLTVWDEGTGIAAEHLSKIFDPFFTTREIGGTGIGLWISKRIIEEHAGNITVDTNVGSISHGTKISIFLPFHNPYSSYELAS